MKSAEECQKVPVTCLVTSADSFEKLVFLNHVGGSQVGGEVEAAGRGSLGLHA